MPRKGRRETAPTTSMMVGEHTRRRRTVGLINRYPRLSTGHVMRTFDSTALELELESGRDTRDPGYADARIRINSPFQGHTARLIAELQRRESQRGYYGEILERAALHLQRVGRAAEARKYFLRTAASQRLRWKNSARRIQRFWAIIRQKLYTAAQLLLKKKALQQRLRTLRPWRVVAHKIILQQRGAAMTIQQFYKRMRNRWRKARSWQTRRIASVLTVQRAYRIAILRRKRKRRFRLQEAWSVAERTMIMQRRALMREAHMSYQHLRACFESLKLERPPKPLSFAHIIVTPSSYSRLVTDELVNRSALSDLFVSSLFVLQRRHREQLSAITTLQETKCSRLLSQFQQEIDSINGNQPSTLSDPVLDKNTMERKLMKGCSLWCQSVAPSMTEPEEAKEQVVQPSKRGVAFEINHVVGNVLSDKCYTPEVLLAAAELWGSSLRTETPGLSSLCSSVTPEVVNSKYNPVRPDSAPPYRRSRAQSAPLHRTQ
eukprot:TRINITY_DN22532_c0_g1_i1.p1 TRINITY_DN22532_c0_g1~~TRINITY_DN22532_c0_g1_i1.p1  ORF type:complete len:490 (+),score=71.97 TRINITY_DN22532_c0_g1_i1:92-1561(+)